jgi:Iap family predicted aminopeptidase
MLRKIMILVTIVLAMATVATAQTAQELRVHVEYLASPALNGRAPGSEGMKKARKYVWDRCQELGLKTYTQKVNVNGTACYNVVAVLPGRSELCRVVVGAHLDHIGRGNLGADDNASGCAAVLGLAERLSEGPHYPTIEFHWYTGEERGLLGSKNYVKKPLAPIDSYKVMVNLDMVGRMGYCESAGQQAFLYNPILERLYTKYPFAEEITWAEDTGDSDHSSWWQAGVPAVILHTGLHPDYHKPTDTSDKLNYGGMSRVCDYAYDFINAVSVKESPSYPVPYIIYGD